MEKLDEISETLKRIETLLFHIAETNDGYTKREFITERLYPIKKVLDRKYKR